MPIHLRLTVAACLSCLGVALCQFVSFADPTCPRDADPPSRREADSPSPHSADPLGTRPSNSPAATAKPGYRNGAVVAVSPPAVDVGLAVLRKGGTAADAAVAVALAMAVTYPAAGNIGGGGFMTVVPPAAAKRQPLVIDYRETAPALATADMLKDENWYSARAVGVPGTVRGLALAHAEFGKLPWREVVAPAVQLAREGFVLSESLADSLNRVVATSADFPELVRVFGKDNGKGKWRAGDVLKQTDLAATLTRIAEQGPSEFYTGRTAELIEAKMKREGGLIRRGDLADYRAKLRQPVRGQYRGCEVFAPPPPSSGGICLVQMFNMLAEFDLAKSGPRSAETVHVYAEVMRRAFCDRARYLGDADFVKIPPHLTTCDHALTLLKSFDPRRATPSATLAPDIPLADEPDSTTHFSIIDRDGLAISNTYTLERSYGSRLVVEGAGFLLNNEMMDFNCRPGVTDRTGRIGTEPNRIAPGKRMLSSQCPTIVCKDGKVLLITGSPGGRTIINTVLCVVTNVLDHKMDIRAAVDAPRLHHQWLPDELRLERGPDVQQAALVKALTERGHAVITHRQGDAHSIFVDPRTGEYHPAEDRRIEGKAAGY